SAEPLPWSGWAYQGGGSLPSCTSNRWLSPGPGPRSCLAAASAASGAAASGRSRWDSRSAFPRVSPARIGCGLAFSLVGRRPASGRGLDVYADQTLADAFLGFAGRGAYGVGWFAGLAAAGSFGLVAQFPAPLWGAPVAGRFSVAVWPTSTLLPVLLFIP